MTTTTSVGSPHNILQPLHHHRRSFLQPFLLRSPHAALPQHLRQSPQQSFKLKLYIPPSKNTNLFPSASAEPLVISSFNDDVPASTGTKCAAVIGFGGFAGCLRRRRRHNSNNNNNNAATRTDLTTIATMAPVDNFLYFLRVVAEVELEEGDGARARKKGLQAFNGGPQRSMFLRSRCVPRRGR
ncbi:hypothetical protein V8G54_000385 [Vigna mungo]|uniref:Uncharacterized protein n=1 Tax=Vigna mungo TaxID=3915 RepID=A0AAQ3SAJ2_VIGMU